MTKSPDRFSWKMRLLLLLILTVCTFEFTLSCPRHTVVPAFFFQIVTKMCVFCLQERQRHWCCNSTQCIQAALGFPHRFAPRRTVFIPRSTSVDDQGQSVRNCDCEKSPRQYLLDSPVFTQLNDPFLPGSNVRSCLVIRVSL